uniref:G-protein coupled receptors family 2 profile 2 domain-containing protein n=1 Tax=Rhizochromulina marina TaxID=1034831 RepID=A0A7S2WUS0_9STRA|mmetsp:Transcript_4402/g.13124  ORF Transcript_4402/g.13124 Transcript_4402/m.13124 type:complete len:389 (+) Transcript_4402:123-1289(+)
MWTTDTYVVVVASSISFLCSLWLLACFLWLPNWRSRPAGSKHVLLVLVVFNLLAAGNYLFLHPSMMPDTCWLQASIMQFFEVGSWVWTALLSVEILRHVYRVAHRLGLHYTENGICVFRSQLLVYWFIVLCYSTFTTVWLNVHGEVGRAGSWCWTPDRFWQESTYIMLWATFVVIAICSAGVIRITRKLRAGATVVAGPGGRSLSSNSATVKIRRALSGAPRLLLIPLGYMLLHAPGSLNRCADLFNCPSCTNNFTVVLQAACDPSQGTLNALFFGILDSTLRRELGEKLGPWISWFRGGDHRLLVRAQGAAHSAHAHPSTAVERGQSPLHDKNPATVPSSSPRRVVSKEDVGNQQGLRRPESFEIDEPHDEGLGEEDVEDGRRAGVV